MKTSRVTLSVPPPWLIQAITPTIDSITAGDKRQTCDGLLPRRLGHVKLSFCSCV